MQEVFLQAWRSAPHYDPSRGSPEAWLIMMARSRAIDSVRAARRAPHRPEAEPLPEIPGPVSMWPAAVEARALVTTALQELTSAQREVLELAFYEGLSQAEIATRTGAPLGTVKTRTRMALERLRQTFADEGMVPVTRPEMVHEPFGEWSALAAVGALDGAERARFDAHLASGCATCEASLREFSQVTAALPWALPDVPLRPEVRDRLMDRVAAQRRARGTLAGLGAAPSRPREGWPASGARGGGREGWSRRASRPCSSGACTIPGRLSSPSAPAPAGSRSSSRRSAPSPRSWDTPTRTRLRCGAWTRPRAPTAGSCGAHPRRGLHGCPPPADATGRAAVPALGRRRVRVGSGRRVPGRRHRPRGPDRSGGARASGTLCGHGGARRAAPSPTGPTVMRGGSPT